MSSSHTEPVLQAPMEQGADGDWVVRSPGVGVWSGAPQPGEVIGEGSVIGRLAVLNRAYALRVGPGSAGQVLAGRGGTAPDDGGEPARIQAVEHGQVLLSIRPMSGEQDAGAAAAIDVSGLSEGQRAVVAPTDGVFYRRPTPDAPEFAKVGDRLVHGQPVGLIEVMKTFNQIQFEASDPGSDAEVIEVRAQDSTEVRAGDVLLVVKDS